MASVDLEKVVKHWNQVYAVRDLSLTIPHGEFLVLLGPSGCGKTTTMRVVAGLETPNSGIVRIGEEDVSALEPGVRDVAMVFQSYSLYPQMSVYENIRFPLRARKVPRADHDARVRQAAALVELTDYLERKPGALSGGQRQRVALARAIVRSPRVFLMDEPLSNLDARLRVSMRAQIRRIHDQLGTTTIYVTHDQLEAMTLADRVVVMNDGQIEQIGTPRQIYDDPRTRFVASFVGSPAMNLVDGEIADGRFRANGINIAVSRTVRFGPAVLGIRPEDLATAPVEGAEIAGAANVVELIGDATLLTLATGNERIVAKVGKDCDIKTGDAVGLSLLGRPFLFDHDTGLRLDQT